MGQLKDDYTSLLEHELKATQAELAEARAQIAAKDADLAVLVPCVRASVEYFGKDDADKALLAALHRQETALNALR